MTQEKKNEQYKQIPQDFLLSKQQLGRGQFGEVFEGYKQGQMDEQLAIKVIPKSLIEQYEEKTPGGKQKLQESIRREALNQKRIKNKNIVQMIDFVQSDHNVIKEIQCNNFLNPKFSYPFRNKIYFILEFCDTTLSKFLKEKQIIPESEAQILFLQLMNGIKSLHENNIAHRDLKPDNIMLKNGIIQICDFGLSKELEDIQNVEHTKVGTPKYMSPNYPDDDFDPKANDIWSIGYILYEMVFEKSPWPVNGQSHIKYMNSIRTIEFTIPTDIKVSIELIDFLKILLNKNQNQRNWPEIQNHRWIKSDDVKDQYILEKSVVAIKGNILPNLYKKAQSEIVHRQEREVSSISSVSSNSMSEQQSQKLQEQFLLAQDINFITSNLFQFYQSTTIEVQIFDAKLIYQLLLIFLNKELNIKQSYYSETRELWSQEEEALLQQQTFIQDTLAYIGKESDEKQVITLTQIAVTHFTLYHDKHSKQTDSLFIDKMKDTLQMLYNIHNLKDIQQFDDISSQTIKSRFDIKKSNTNLTQAYEMVRGQWKHI